MPVKKPRLQSSTALSRLRHVTHLRFLNFVLSFALIGSLFLLFTSAATLVGYYGSIEKDQVNRINYARALSSRGSLKHIECLNALAERQAKDMADRNYIYHTSNADLMNRVQQQCGGAWSIIGENVGVGSSSTSIFNAFMASPDHKNNIIESRYAKVGVGAYKSANGAVWIAQLFANCSNCGGGWNTDAIVAVDPVAPTTAPSPVEYTHLLRNANTAGSPDVNFKYGISSYRHLYCDWDGNGTDTVGMYYNGYWYLRNSNTAGPAEITINYGYAGAKPVCGDWDGNGTDTIGIYDAGNWSLRNSNTAGNPDIAFAYGYAAALPVVGDWDGNRTDTIGIYDAGNWNLRNTNNAGSPNIAFAYGYGGTTPVVGDWDGNGTDTVGIYVSGNWSLRNSNNAGSPNIAFAYGASGYLPVVGDWDGTRTSTVGVLIK